MSLPQYFRRLRLAPNRFAKPSATDEELELALRAAHVWAVVDAMPDGLATVVGDRGHRMSGGEKQRVAIARLLLHPVMTGIERAA